LNFEKINLNIDHFSVYYNIFNYRHIVEKGKWEVYAKYFCLKNINYFNPSNREFQNNNFFYQFNLQIRYLKFYILGFLFSKK